mgnify:CR=1 FL=1
MAEVRGMRKTRTGVVVSDKMDKTIVVEIRTRVKHPLYGKYVVKSKKYHVHDELGCGEGDKVEIKETKPISKTVSWVVTKILEKAEVL